MILLSTVFLSALMMLLVKGKGLKQLNILALLGMSIEAGWIVFQTFSRGQFSSTSLLCWDALSALMLSVIVFISDYVVLASFSYLENDVKEGKIASERLNTYYFWMWVFIGSMLLVVSTSNLGVIWVAIEGTTLATTLLVGFYKQKQAVEAAWKYISLCTVGISFALLGTLILYAASGTVNGYTLKALDWRVVTEMAAQVNPTLLKLGFVFAFTGYATKVGLVPMHPWLPDAHSQSPSPVSALLSGVLLNCALYAILRWHILVSHSQLGWSFSGRLLMIFGLISLGVMVAFILLQKDIKRLLAYSSVEHMGILALGFGIGTPLAIWGATLHLILHALTKASLFMVVGRIVQMTGTRQIFKMRGIMTLYPLSGILLLGGLLSITGIPPFGTFRSEFSILASLFQTQHPIEGFLAALFLTIIFAAFLYRFISILYAPPNGRVHKENERRSVLGLAVPLILVLALGIFIPQGLNDALDAVVKLIMGGVGHVG